MKGNEALKQRMMDYLYGEMPRQEKISFEQELRDNPAWQKELDMLRQVRSALSGLGEVEKVAPVMLQMPEKRFQRGANGNVRWYKPVTAVAASFILIFMMAYLTDLRMQKLENGWFLSFGPAPALMNAEKVKQLIREETDNSAIHLSNQLEERQQAILHLLSTEYINKKEADYIRSKDDKSIQEWLATHAGEQQEFVQKVLEEYDQYLARQRIQDLLLIEQSLVHLREEQDYQFMQTEEILSELLSSISLESK